MTEPTPVEPKPNPLFGADKWSSIIGYALAAAVEIFALVEEVSGALGLSPKTKTILHVVAGSIAIIGRVLNLLPKAAAVLVLCALATPARADSSPGGPLSLYLGTFRGESVTLNFGLGLSGYAYDFGTRAVTRNVQFTGLTELSVGAFPVALIGGAGFQTGENQGLALQIGPEYRPLNAAVLFTAVPVGSTQSYGVAAGYVLRF
jgi:hypothetical protein